MWKDLFLYTRANMSQLFKDPEKVKNWEFANELAFARLDKFVERVAVVEVCAILLSLHKRFGALGVIKNPRIIECRN